jgi:N-acyl homoserine lactone hydrolase
MRFVLLVVAVLAAALGSRAASAAGADKLYVLDCGHISAPDQSRWSPGVNVGVPLELSDNCYLIHHAQGWFLWDTGLPDAIEANPEGVKGGNGFQLKRSKTLAAQLQELGVKPSDLKAMAISHTHPDHIGNVELFPQVMLFVQKAEYEWPGEGGAPRFNPNHPVTKLEGDHDVFGDGSVVIISTPGHTPGHQALLVRLPQTGALVLSGDAVHFKDNWDNRRVPVMNVDKDQTVASMQHIADILAKERGQLWINHDAPQTAAQKKAPEFYE